MNIKSIESVAVRVPLSRSFGGSRYNVDRRCAVFTRMETDGGLVSEVYNGDNRTHGGEIVRIIHEELAPLVVGGELFAVERHWERMFALASWNRDRALVMQAIACVDSALWDLAGRALGVNVCRLLGGYRAEMPIIAIAGYYEDGKTLDDLAREMEWLQGAGMAGCKVKVGGLSPEQDAARVAAAREGAGPDFVLAVDANRGWNVRDAIRFAALVEPYGIGWFEEPCHWYDDARAMAEVRRASRIPVNAGQSEITAHGVRRLVAAGAVELVNFDASEGGGVTEWRRAAGLCALHDVRMAHHEEPQLALHLLSAVPHGTCVECFADPERDPIWAWWIRNRPPAVNGRIAVPQGPGFGLELDWEQVEKHRLG